MTSCLRVGFVGVGAIGAPMAQRIHDAGHALRVFSRSAARAQRFAAQGVPVHTSAAELAAHCAAVCLCVSHGQAVEDVVFGPQGLAAGGRPGLLVIDLSTIHPVQARGMADRLQREHGMHWVDAPVSGGPAGARAGTLAVFAGGRSEDVARALPVLRSFAGRVTHLGPAGSGMAGNAFSQMPSFGSAAIITETLHLAAQFGIDPALIPDAVAGGFADSNVLRHDGRAMAEGNDRGNTRTASGSCGRRCGRSPSSA